MFFGNDRSILSLTATSRHEYMPQATVGQLF